MGPFLVPNPCKARTKTRTPMILIGNPIKVSSPLLLRANLRTDRIKVTQTALLKSNGTKANKMAMILKSILKKSIKKEN